MGISIKHDEIERAIRQLASERGVSLTEAVGTAVRNELRHAALRPSLRERVAQIQDRVAERGTVFRHPDDVIGYDENGVPR